MSQARWRKSTRSGNTANCVEVATLIAAVAVRDSKDPAGPVLDVGTSAWTAFVTGLRTGTLD